LNYLRTASLGLLFLIIFCCSYAYAIDLYGYGSYWSKEDADGSWGAGVGLALPIIADSPCL
jgi:hypothetical protein